MLKSEEKDQSFYVFFLSSKAEIIFVLSCYRESKIYLLDKLLPFFITLLSKNWQPVIWHYIPIINYWLRKYKVQVTVKNGLVLC